MVLKNDQVQSQNITPFLCVKLDERRSSLSSSDCADFCSRPLSLTSLLETAHVLSRNTPCFCSGKPHEYETHERERKGLD